jgi:hypothetical protein
VRTQFGYYVFWVSHALDRWVAEFEDRWRRRTICAPRYAKSEQCAPTG